MRQFFVETIKGNRNEERILKLKQDIRDNVKLLSELGLKRVNLFGYGIRRNMNRNM